MQLWTRRNEKMSESECNDMNVENVPMMRIDADECLWRGYICDWVLIKLEMMRENSRRMTSTAHILHLKKVYQISIIHTLVETQLTIQWLDRHSEELRE